MVCILVLTANVTRKKKPLEIPAVLNRPFPVGTTSVLKLKVQRSSENLESKDLKIKLLLVEEQTPKVLRLQEMREHRPKKPSVVYILVDLDLPNCMEVALTQWKSDIEEVFHRVSHSTVLVGYSATGKGLTDLDEDNTRNAFDKAVFDLGVTCKLLASDSIADKMLHFLFAPGFEIAQFPSHSMRYLSSDAVVKKLTSKKFPSYARWFFQKRWCDANEDSLCHLSMLHLNDSSPLSLFSDKVEKQLPFTESLLVKHQKSIDEKQITWKPGYRGLNIMFNFAPDFDPTLFKPGFWEHLFVFACSFNKFSKLVLSGDGVSMKSLLELYASHNLISFVDPAIGGLSQLRVLDLGCNLLEQFPETILQLNQLEVLDLGCNQISLLPSDFGSLTSLQILNLELNNLQTLPASFFTLPKLQELDLQYNRLTTPVAQFSDLSLSLLLLEGNPCFTSAASSSSPK